KQCFRCGEKKPIEQFSPCRHDKSGLYSYCKACVNEAHRKQHFAKQGRVPPESLPPVADGFKRCYTCKSTKPLIAFAKHRSARDGYRGTCRDCSAE
ncbi:MAG: hypothetical protein EOO77_38530, partial [Oxalobacteraceae bacterium]